MEVGEVEDIVAVEVDADTWGAAEVALVVVAAEEDSEDIRRKIPSST